MRNLLKYAIRISNMALVALIMAACSDDNNSGFTTPGDERSLTLMLDISGSSASTRSGMITDKEEGNIDADGVTSNPNLNETKVNTAKAIIFNPEGTIKYTSESVYLPPASDNEMRTLMVNIPKAYWNDFNGQTEYTIYILLNYSGDIAGNESLSDIQQKTVTEAYNTGTQPDGFVMTGLCKWNIDMSRNNDGDQVADEVEMTRVAAKFRVRYPVFPNGNIVVHSPDGEEQMYRVAGGDDAVSISFKRYRNSSYLEPDIYQNQAIPGSEWAIFLPETDFRPMIDETNLLFYSYPHEWEDASSADRSYIEYKIFLEEQSTGVSKAYYYFIPVAGTNTNNPEGYNKVKRNYLYDITPVIETLGSTSNQEPVEIKGNYKIKEWTTNELDVDLSQAHYFLVQEHDVIMGNITQNVNKFAATRKVKVEKILEVFFYKYAQAGSDEVTKKKQYIRAGMDGYPSFDVDNINKTITTDATILDNYSPKYFTVIFSDEGGLEETVEFVQYPSIYVTGEYSEKKYLNPNVEYLSQDDQKNFNLFTITSITNDIFTTGDPSYVGTDGKIRTREDTESNQLVSPKFIIASQRGIFYNTTGSDDAKKRCLNYAEGGHPIGTWRVPTRAEIEFIDHIQDDRNSAVTSLLTGSKYWSAEYPYRYNFGSNDWTESWPYWGSIRCVHDVY